MHKPVIVIVGLTVHDETEVHRDLEPLRHRVEFRYERPLEKGSETQADHVIVLLTHIDGSQLAEAAKRYGHDKVHQARTVDTVVRKVCMLASID